MAKKYNRDMPLPSSDGLFGGPGKGGPGKGGPGKGKAAKPSNPFSARNFSFETPSAPKKETYESRKASRDELYKKKKALREAYMRQGKSTTMSFGKGMSKEEYKKKLNALNTQIQGTRRKSDKLVAAKTKVRESLRSKSRKGSGSRGKCSMTATTRSASCSKAGDKKSSVGGKF